MARPKKIVVPQTNTAVIYARVSTREQSEEGYSIDAQLALLREYALRNSLTVVQEYVESESAKVSGRTAFAAMTARIKADGVRAVLVEKTDRLYRNLKDYVRIDELDIEVHLVKEGEVISKDSRSHEKFVHGIKLLMARNYSDNLSEEAKKGMLEKAKQGIWPTKAPLGYLNVAEGSRRVIAIDPERAPLVTWLFKRYAEDMVSLKALRAEAVLKGLTTRKGRHVAVNEIHSILQNPVYYGLIRWGGFEIDGIHAPLIDKATFQRVQEVMSGRNQTKEKPASARDFLYHGLFTCGLCGCQISAQSTKGHHYYACTGARGCTRRVVREEGITEAIAEKLSGMEIRPEVLSLIRRALVENSSEEESLRVEELSKFRTKQDGLNSNLRKLYVDKLAGTVSEGIYNELRLQWEFELVGVESAIEAYSNTRKKYEEDGLALIDFASNAYFRFKTASREDKREMAKNLLSNSTIIDRKVQVCFHEAFEMILQANQEIPRNAPSSMISEKWLPD